METEPECRLCGFSCDKFKCLFEDECETEIYKIATKYFSQSLLNFGVICTECWQHIFNFHSFQQWILSAQENETNLEEILCNENSVNVLSNAKSLGNEAEFSLDSTNQSKNNHIANKRYECETCGASFSHNGNLSRHIRKQHKLQPLRTPRCLDCNKVFKSRSYLERHRQQFHSNRDSKKDEYNEEENSADSSLLLETGEIIQISQITEESLHESESEINSNESQIEKEIQAQILEIVGEDHMSTDSESYSNSNDLPASIFPKPLKEDAENENILACDDVIAKWKKDLECPKCKKYLTNFSMLNEHFQSEHAEERCHIVCCDEPLFDRRNIVEHLQLHENPSAFKCNNCGKNFNNSKGLNSHKLQVHSEHRSAYHLHLCYCKRSKELHAESKERGQKYEYDTFICCQRKKKILEDDALIAEWKKELQCVICNATFPYYSLMRMHYYHEHPGEKCYIYCCERKISRISDAIEHIRFHLDPKIFQCKDCNIKFSGRSSLSKHMRAAHLGSLPRQKWACNECDKTFKMRQILTRHKNVYHSKKV